MLQMCRICFDIKWIHNKNCAQFNCQMSKARGTPSQSWLQHESGVRELRNKKKETQSCAKRTVDGNKSLKIPHNASRRRSSPPSLALKYECCIRLIPVDVLDLKSPQNNLTLPDKHAIWHLGLEAAGGCIWNYSFWVFRQTQKTKERNVLLRFCAPRPCALFFLLIFFCFIFLWIYRQHIER